MATVSLRNIWQMLWFDGILGCMQSWVPESHLVGDTRAVGPRAVRPRRRGGAGPSAAARRLRGPGRLAGGPKRAGSRSEGVALLARSTPTGAENRRICSVFFEVYGAVRRSPAGPAPPYPFLRILKRILYHA